MPPAASCTFFMLDADFVRSFRGTTLPFYQEIREKHSDAILGSRRAPGGDGGALRPRRPKTGTSN